MNIKKIAVTGLSAFAVILSAGSITSAQSAGMSSGQVQATPTPPLQVKDVVRQPSRIAQGANLYCSGRIQNASVDIRLEVVGGEEEQEQRVYSQGDFIYVKGGAGAGMRENDRFMVTRPRGSFRSRFSRKGKLGIFVQEVGMVRIVRVKPEIAVAVIENACETILLGDLLMPQQTRIAPVRRAEEQQPLDRFADPNGKATGRIVLALDGREMLARDEIVYLDLGAEDNVKSGDYLTIYRPVGKGNLNDGGATEIVSAKDPGFESEEYRGGKFSIQAPRRKGENADGKIATTPNVKSRRPALPRKIVGEVVIISVQQRTATAVITRTAQEVHTGDFVELQ